MLRSMNSAISGMQSFQTMLDVIGNNIANVNTPGFKAQEVDFSDVMNQTLSGGSAPSTTQGGTNPRQVGLGTTVAAINTNFADGSPQSTGNSLDLALQGSGFFLVSPDGGATQYLTREGDFSLDSNDNLVLPNSTIALGYTVDSKGNPVTAAGTTKVNLEDYLQSYVSQLSGSKVSPNADGSFSYTDGSGNKFQYSLASPANLQIGANGSLTATVNVTETPAGGTATSSSTPTTLGFMALGAVNNPGGLEKVGDSMYMVSNNSGKVSVGQAGANGTGTINAGYLEGSNVDLTQEFSNMIIAQQGFTANSKMITTDNVILQDVDNLKSTQ